MFTFSVSESDKMLLLMIGTADECESSTVQSRAYSSFETDLKLERELKHFEILCVCHRFEHNNCPDQGIERFFPPFHS